MQLVANREEYWDFVCQLRNHHDVRPGFIQQQHITKEEHFMFMEKYGKNYYVCLVNKNPAGFVGVINDDIRVATHPDYQGQGVGKFMITELMKKHPESVAKVKVDNVASLRLFESCGFHTKYYILEKDADVT